MRAEDKSFYFLATPSYYDIPFFQRAYVWSEENWSELFNNLTSKNQNHFLGSIILKNELAAAGSVARFSVIDGQQRLTTLSILLRACYDHIVKNAASYNYDESDVKTCQVQMESILFVPEGGIKKKLHVKINHSHLDKKAFESVINGELDTDDRWEKYTNLDDEDTTSSIIKAYAFFRDELEDVGQETIDYLWELLTVDKIKFLVNIDLDVNDNEQAIFDTVNSAGVRLSSADTIKNLLYQRYVELLRTEDPTTVDERAVVEYEETWVDAFVSDESINAYWETQRQYGRMKRSNIETFLHAFAVVQGFFNPAENNMADLPQEYRKKISKMDITSLEDFLKELHDYADVFREYFSNEDSLLTYDDYVGRIFNISNVLEVSTFHPYLLQQLYYLKNESIEEDDIKSRFFVLEKYIVLNAICKGSTKNYNNECLQLVDEKKTPQEVLESCQYISEGNFVNGLRRMTTNKLPTLLLFWIELYQRNLLNVDIKILKYEYTLEHIMPQKWAQNWYDVPVYDIDENEVEDADEMERIRSHAIYEIGNMTLLNSKLNTSISNGNFKDKINGKNGRKGIKDLADIRLTRKVIDNNTEWNELKIYARTSELEAEIRKIWDAGELPVEAIKVAAESGGRKKIRFAFWEKALPVIREKNQYEMFTNVNPSTSNTVSGYFGIGGFHISCTANYDRTRVEFILDKAEAEQNKKAFDILYANKQAIEDSLGVKLSWDRLDEYKMSWIYYSLEDVSITNKDDWDKMAAFLGEWSDKFRKVIVPYLVDEFSQDSSELRSTEDIARLQKIAEILRIWTVKTEAVIDNVDKCNRTCTRFTTKAMSKILPDVPNSPSGWNTDNHYFYEIVNRNGKDILIQLSLSSRNASSEFMEMADRINEIVSMKQAKKDWQWWKIFKTSKILLSDNLDENEVFAGLDKALIEVQKFEEDLAHRLNI
ncbi:MAG: DUF4268 domain-containing protein [Lachnospiraceae bacterium]|nr:DUF4268 domain-containing protein [Lachnospiraceae bacterium]